MVEVITLCHDALPWVLATLRCQRSEGHDKPHRGRIGNHAVTFVLEWGDDYVDLAVEEPRSRYLFKEGKLHDAH